MCEDIYNFLHSTGGDEFVMALKCSSYASDSKLGVFFTKLKSEINKLGSNIEQFTNTETEWKEAKEKLDKVTDRDGNPLDMSIVGISTGVFVSSETVKDNDWCSYR